MLFLTALEQRIIIVSIVQSWPILYNSYFTFKLLKRSKNKVTISLSSFFLTNIAALVVLLISIFTANTPFSYPFYIIGYYLFFFSYSFLNIFSWLVLKIDRKGSYKLIIILIISYSISCCYIFLMGIIFSGIQYGIITGWVPVFSLSFAIISWIYIVLFYFVPEIIIAHNLRRTFQNSPIKNRIYLMVISIIMGFFVVVFTILYNFWIDNSFYRSIHTFINLPLGTIGAYLLYKSVGKELT